MTNNIKVEFWPNEVSSYFKHGVLEALAHLEDISTNETFVFVDFSKTYFTELIMTDWIDSFASKKVILAPDNTMKPLAYTYFYLYAHKRIIRHIMSACSQPFLFHNLNLVFSGATISPPPSSRKLSLMELTLLKMLVHDQLSFAEISRAMGCGLKSVYTLKGRLEIKIGMQISKIIIYR